jgi:hypothetical protein
MVTPLRDYFKKQIFKLKSNTLRTHKHALRLCYKFQNRVSVSSNGPFNNLFPHYRSFRRRNLITWLKWGQFNRGTIHLFLVEKTHQSLLTKCLELIAEAYLPTMTVSPCEATTRTPGISSVSRANNIVGSNPVRVDGF